MKVDILPGDKTITLTITADHPALTRLREHATYAGEQADGDLVRLRFVALNPKQRREIMRRLIRLSSVSPGQTAPVL